MTAITGTPGPSTQNSDADELARFNELAHQWWDREGEFKALHDINGLRLDYIERPERVEGLRVLDVGCGGGILSEGLTTRGAKVTGIDLADAALQVAKLHALDSDLEIDYREISIEALAAEHPEPFDIITCLEMLEHVPEPESILQAAATLLKPNGLIFISTLHRQLRAFLLAIVGAEYLTNMVPRGTHEYDKFIRPSELARGLRNAGFSIEDLTGMSYNPIIGQFALSRDVSVNYFIRARLAASVC